MHFLSLAHKLRTAVQFLVTTFDNVCRDEQKNLGFLSMLGASTWEDVSVSIIVSAIILLYCMLPGVKRAFATA
jgi:hypothetical protein